MLFLFFQLHSDVDSGNGNIKYILSGEGAGTIFVIDDKTGNIHATKTLDREEQAQYTLTAQAVARDTNKPLEPPSEFIVKVQDINDNPPEFLHGPYYARVAEMSNVGECEPLEKHICQLLLFLYEPTPDSLFLMHYSKDLKSDSQKVSRYSCCNCCFVTADLSLCVCACVLALFVCMCLCLLHFHCAIHHQ